MYTTKLFVLFEFSALDFLRQLVGRYFLNNPQLKVQYYELLLFHENNFQIEAYFCYFPATDGHIIDMENQKPPRTYAVPS